MCGELMDKIHDKMSKNGFIRKDLSNGCMVSYVNERGDIHTLEWYGIFELSEWNEIWESLGEKSKWIGKDCKIIGHRITLMDCIKAIQATPEALYVFLSTWNYDKPYLQDQTEEVIEKLSLLI